MEINLLDGNQLSLLRKLIADAGKIVIIVHKSPDGDAMGALLAWGLYLRSLGKEVTCVIPNAAPDFLTWLPANNTIVRYDKHPAEVQCAFDEADLVCCLDFNSLSRTNEVEPILQACKAPRLLIDHHENPDVEAALAVSEPSMSSTCEIVFRLVWQLGGYDAMTPQMAQCIYCGMMTDTGAFTYNSNSPAVYLIISKLLEKGIDKDRIYKRVFNSYSANAIRFRSYLISDKLKAIPSLHASYFFVTKVDMKRFRFIKGDLEGVVNVPLQIKGQKLSISLREDTEQQGIIHVSLRSSNGFHCRPMAEQFFHGGGHDDAAGGRLTCSVEEAEQIVLQAITAFKGELQ